MELDGNEPAYRSDTCHQLLFRSQVTLFSILAKAQCIFLTANVSSAPLLVADADVVAAVADVVVVVAAVVVAVDGCNSC